MARVFFCNLAQRAQAALRVARRTDVTGPHSVLLLTECQQGMARRISAERGWGTLERQSWFGIFDEHVVWNPGKYRLLDARGISLSTESGDWADLRRRAVAWALLENRETGDAVWYGASHLSHTGDQPRTKAQYARRDQATRLAATAPEDGHELLLGIDRNAGPHGMAGKALEGRLPLLTPRLKDSFRGDGYQPARAAIDGLHGTVTLASYEQVTMGNLTDHAAISAVAR